MKLLQRIKQVIKAIREIEKDSRIDVGDVYYNTGYCWYRPYIVVTRIGFTTISYKRGNAIIDNEVAVDDIEYSVSMGFFASLIRKKDIVKIFNQGNK